MNAQVVVFGHKLSPEALATIEGRYGPVKVFEAFFHAPQMHQQVMVTRRCINQLYAQGCDLTGNTITLIALPGLSVASTLMAAAWAGVTGELPVVINMIKQTTEDQLRTYYAPSPELPFVNLQTVRNDYGRLMRAQQFRSNKAQTKVAA